MFTWIANHVGHGSLLPTCVDFRVAFLARGGTDVVRRGGRSALFSFFLGRCQSNRANEENQLPCAVVILSAVRISECWHPCQAHAVGNDVMNFAVGESLRFLPPQIRRLGVKILADPRPSITVLAVAARAVVGEIFTRFLQEVRSRGPRIFLISRALWDAQVPHGLRHDRLNGGGLIGCAESSP